jgi:tetratricopeptide (TPR) repeat protein
MSAQRTIRRVSLIALTARAAAFSLRPLLAMFALLLPLAGGCETEKQQRFREYTDDGVHLYQRGDYVGAREQFEVALPLGPKDANLLCNLGQCYDRLNHPDQAENYYKQCLDVNANHAECRHALAVLLYRNGRRAEADQMIQGWLASQPELGAAYAEEGWRLRHSGEYQLAIGRFQQALHYEPRNQRAMLELGQLYEEQQRPEFALTMYSRALELNPQQPELKERINLLKAKGTGKPLPD